MNKLKDHLQELSGKTALVRCNFDVPIEDGKVQDTTRIEDAVATIKALRDNQNKVILIAHYDRPDGKFSPDKSLGPVATVLEDLIGQPVSLIDYQQDYHQLNPKDQDLCLVENLRFWEEEEENDADFAQTLASWADFYVNQAFANCHRAHASIVGITKHLPSFAGLNLAAEVEILEKIRNNPDKPLVVVIGGAKLETKEPLIEVFADKADHILVGGKAALDLHDKSAGLPPNVTIADLLPDGRDITEDSARQFADRIKSAQTVIWNGTMGVFEEEDHQQGTRIVAEAVNSTPAFTLVGGGDTETALTELNLEHGIDFISTGGGAMLTFLSEGDLVGLQPLRQQ